MTNSTQKSIIILRLLHYNGINDGAIIGANYKVNKWWCSLWDGLIERPTLCRIAGDPWILLILITTFLPHSASLYFFSPRMPGECKASKWDHAGLLTTAAIYANTINI